MTLTNHCIEHVNFISNSDELLHNLHLHVCITLLPRNNSKFRLQLSPCLTQNRCRWQYVHPFVNCPEQLRVASSFVSRFTARRDLTTWCPTGWSFTWHFVLKRACEPFIGCIFLGQKARAGIKPATACFPIERRANTSPITARRSQPFFGQVWTHFGKQQYFLPLTTLNNSTIDTRGSKVS